MKDWHLCDKHQKALARHESARRNWTLLHPNPEPEEKTKALLSKIRKAAWRCGHCWPLGAMEMYSKAKATA